MGKTVLILGNGFDLAHSLPTRYSNFLDFCQKVEYIWSFNWNKSDAINEFHNIHIDSWDIDESIRTAIEDAFKNRKVEKNEVTSDNNELSEIHDMLNYNIWYNYFNKLHRENKMRGENWIDFEFEIRSIIEEVDRKTSTLSDKWSSIEKKSKLFYFANQFRYCIEKRKEYDENQFNDLSIKDVRKETYYDLERLIRALELYLSVFVEKIELKSKIPEIDNLNPDYVINFNYTNTYERNYKKRDIHYIHGKADANRPIEDNNLVLGIDEYWSPDECDQHTFFTIFKKFSQRIQKHTGNSSYKYLGEIEKMYDPQKRSWSGRSNVDQSKDHPDQISNIYIFGHSLDITDKDILSSFIGNEATSVTVYCFDKGTEGELIANTIKLIGEKTLVNKANSVPSKFNFIIQEPAKDMTPV